MFSFVWWITGFYWVSLGGQALARGSPQLYWLVLVSFFRAAFLVFKGLLGNAILTLLMLYFLQALYNFSCFWCVLCCFLRCTGMHNRHCSLLLSSMYYCHPICCGRSGNFQILFACKIFVIFLYAMLICLCIRCFSFVLAFQMVWLAEVKSLLNFKVNLESSSLYGECLFIFVHESNSVEMIVLSQWI